MFWQKLFEKKETCLTIAVFGKVQKNEPPMQRLHIIFASPSLAHNSIQHHSMFELFKGLTSEMRLAANGTALWERPSYPSDSVHPSEIATCSWTKSAYHYYNIVRYIYIYITSHHTTQHHSIHRSGPLAFRGLFYHTSIRMGSYYHS